MSHKNNLREKKLKILLLANNIVGYEITRYLVSQDESIVGLCLHNKNKQAYTKEIIETANIDKKRIFFASQLRTATTINKIKELSPDIAIASFWGYLLKPEFLNIFPMGCINFHPGYLPFNRGMNPNVWPIVEGTPAGVSLHYIDDGIDTGDIIARKKVKIDLDDTAEDVYKKTILEIIKLFKRTWPLINQKPLRRIRQSSIKVKPTFHWAKDVEKLDKIELKKSYTGEQLINILRSRSYNNRYFAYFIKNGQKVYVRVQLSKKPK